MSNFEWVMSIVLAVGIFVSVFWIAMTIAEARQLAKEENKDPFYEDYACAQCGSYTVWRSVGWAICDCCGMKVELD